MILKRILIAGLALVICLALFAALGNSTPSVTADLSYTQADVEMIPISSDVKVVGLGEASHGVAQYQQMKAEVFQSLVKNNGCRTFIIEGDFGNGLKVDRYINGGDGTAEEIVREIGFNIYRTQEMADLLQWMRSYIIVGIGVVLKCLGSAPAAYLILAILADVIDHIEFTSGIRTDGLTMSIHSALMVVGTPCYECGIHGTTGHNCLRGTQCCWYGCGPVCRGTDHGQRGLHMD